MNKFLRRGLLAATVLAVPVGGLLAAPLSAHASSSIVSKVKASTLSSDRADTTSVSGPGTIASANGPQWAYDRLTMSLSGVRDGANTWSVTVTDKGLYEAIADPRTGAIYEGYGNMSGYINYEVQATNVPLASNLPASTDPSVTTSQIVKNLFGGDATIIGGGHYSFTYNGLPGGTYTQVG
jgi:hypothetical protein